MARVDASKPYAGPLDKVLVASVSALGDVIVGSLVADAVVARGAAVDFLVPAPMRPLFADRPGYTMVDEAGAAARRYELCLDLTSNRQSRRLLRAARAAVRVGRVDGWAKRMRRFFAYDVMVGKNRADHIERDFDDLRRWLGETGPRRPRLTPARELPGAYAVWRDRPFAAIHIGARKPKRRIPEPLVVHAARHFAAKGLAVALVGTEEEIARHLQDDLAGVAMYAPLTLPEVRALLSNARLFLGPDSGLLHMAAALERPAVGLFGPNTAARSAPTFPGVAVMERDLPCRPCRQSRPCPRGIACLAGLEPSALTRLIDEKLAGGGLSGQ